MFVVMCISYRIPDHLNEEGELCFKHEKAYFWIDTETRMSDLADFLNTQIRKQDSQPSLVSVCSLVYNNNKQALGHFIATDLDGIDLPVAVSVAEDLEKKYRFGGRRMIVSTNAGFHLFIFKLMSFEDMQSLLHDPIIEPYQDPLHTKISETRKNLQIRVWDTKFGEENTQKIVWERGDHAGPNEAEIYYFIRRFITKKGEGSEEDSLIV